MVTNKKGSIVPEEKTRAYLYRVSMAAMPLLIGAGYVTSTAAVIWIGLVGTLLGFGLASANTSTK